MPRWFRFTASALLAVVFAAGLCGRSSLNQQISGQALDATGAALPGAAIVVNLPTGKYRVICDAPGFKKEVRDDNELNTNVSIEVNFKLQVGSQSESVTVQADAVVVEAANGEVGYTVTGEQASQIQLDGRNFPELDKENRMPCLNRRGSSYVIGSGRGGTRRPDGFVQRGFRF